MRPDIVDGHRSAELACDRREHRVLESAGGDPIRERRRVEIDVERVAVRRDPARHVDADAGDLARWTRQPDAGQPLEACCLDADGCERPDQRVLEIPDVLLHVAAVPLQVEDRIADELARPVVRRLPAAVRLDDLDLRPFRDVQLR